MRRTGGKDAAVSRRRRHPVPAPGAQALPPGTARPRRLVPSLRYELVGCGLHGHALLGTDAAVLRPRDGLFARQDPAGFRWYRCLRCDAWLPLSDPEAPTRDAPPDRDTVALPLRGRPLRDRYVLRAIAVERSLPLLVMAAVVTATFLFAAHRRSLRPAYDRLSADLRSLLGGPATPPHHGLGGDVNALFHLPEWEVYAIALLLAAYTAVLALEMVGLWFGRRWAAYLTLVEASALLPLEVYGVVGGVSWFKVASLAVNLAIVVYLLVAQRLFGLRGGAAAARAQHERDTGWGPLERATPGSLLPCDEWTAVLSTARSPTSTPG